MSSESSHWHNVQARVAQAVLIKNDTSATAEANFETLRLIKNHPLADCFRMGPLTEECRQYVADSVALARTVYKDEALLAEILRCMERVRTHGLR